MNAPASPASFSLRADTNRPTMYTAFHKMSTLQYVIIGLCFMMNMCDGMNVMTISYATNAISKDWHIAPDSFGLVFSAGLLGMAIGAMVLAPKADKLGRKTLILASAIGMGIGSIITGFATSLPVLITCRWLTGIGIGSMLACTSTLAAEYASQKMKSFWISFVMAGYPAGAVLSGLAAKQLIAQQGWQALFIATGLITLLLVPVVLLFLKESLEFLLKKQPAKALHKANIILRSLRETELSGLPEKEVREGKASVSVLFNKTNKVATLILWMAFFLSFATLYFLTSWIPKLASNAGLSPALAIYAGIIFNVGSLLGIILQGYLSMKLGMKRVICFFLLTTAVLMVLFGFVSNPTLLLLSFCFIGFGMQGGFIGLYAVAARLYSTTIRSTGIGWAIGFGRLGAIVGPFFGGIFISQGMSAAFNFVLFSIPVAIAGILTLFIHLNKE